jgi:DNA end-binding protein Ku
VPVRLTPATRSRDVSFNQLEAESGARIRYRRVSEKSGDEVPNDRIVKGYEVAKGKYVMIEKGELEALAPKATRTIEIEDFVDLDEIDPVFFQTPYYVVPEKNAAKPYRLLLEAMTELRKVAIGRVVMRGKEHLVAIRPLDQVLCVETMRYADEIIPVEQLDGLPDADVSVSDKELTMATQLIESLSDEFEADKYHDEYREQVLELIDKKAAGEEIVAQPEVEAPAKVLDLMAALEASLERTGGGRAERPAKATGSSSSSRAAKAPAKKRAPAKKKAAPAKKKRSA